MATWLGPDLSSPNLTLPSGASVLPAMENTETVPSERLATSASVPARLIDTPAAPLPACSCAEILGGDALRSITESLSSGTVFFGSAGSTLDAPVTSAKLSSRATATLKGGPTTLAGAWISATTLGGVALRSMTGTVSGGGLAGTDFTPSTRTALPSLAESASWPLAPDDAEIKATSESIPTQAVWRCMRTSQLRGSSCSCERAAHSPACHHNKIGQTTPCARARRPLIAPVPIRVRLRPAAAALLRCAPP